MSVLFVCLGNICRSPLAEGILIQRLRERGYSELPPIASAGTIGINSGKRADVRSQAVARSNGIQMDSIARQVDPRTDFRNFDLLVPMDQANLSDLLEIGASRNATKLMTSFLPEDHHEHGNDVPDPYWSDDSAFIRVFELIDEAMPGLIEYITARTTLSADEQ